MQVCTVVGTGLLQNFRSGVKIVPGQILVAKFGPAGPGLARWAHFWQPKVVGGPIFGSQNWSGRSLLGKTNFGVTGQLGMQKYIKFRCKNCGITVLTCLLSWKKKVPVMPA